ncbi:WXG100 family type VII secretion target [Micromonospora sp. NPDC051196]|uniref:WXG100 family type VII secretion target n=1 Tax=Micromonospora sp. NPDC051196 TaxID=3155281 RepID=UPI00343E6030
MSNFTFNFAQAQATLENVAGINRRIEQTLDELETDVERSLDGWESEDAKSAYQAAKLRWDQAARQMNGFLESARRALTSVADEYSSSNTSARAKWERG